MKKSALIILLFAIHVASHAQNVLMQGIAKSYPNKEIGVWLISDYISNIQKKLTYSTIDSNGVFLLEFNCKEIQYITLKIEKNIASMYVEPSSDYEIMIMKSDSTTYQNQNLEHDVGVSIKLKNKTEINALTMDYDKRFDNFLDVEYKSFVTRTPQAKIDSFKAAVRDYYSTVINPYFESYVTYTIAALEEKTKMSEKKLFENYIDLKPILYNNPEYMNFFNAFYKQKLHKSALSKEGKSLIFQIDNRASFSGTMETLKNEAFLQNDTIRELVLLKGLYESYYDGTFRRTGITAILQQITQESKISEHQRIALNILNSFSKLRVGSVAPFFELPDQKGRTHSLDELRSKKYIYLIFFDANCSSCLRQMKVIPSLKKQYGERIAFVSVSTDKTTAEFENFCKINTKYDWLFLYDNTKEQLKSDYEIKSIPAYFLINPEGKFVQVPAESPEGEIDRAFYDITKPKGKGHGVGNKKN